jgi:hypothetical protein
MYPICWCRGSNISIMTIKKGRVKYNNIKGQVLMQQLQDTIKGVEAPI